MYHETSCGFVLVNPNTHKILVLKLAKQFEWDFPKGQREEGE